MGAGQDGAVHAEPQVGSAGEQPQREGNEEDGDDEGECDAREGES